MRIEEVYDSIYCIDTLIGNEEKIIASYLVDFDKVAIIEPGPKSVAKNVIDAINEIGVKRVDYIFVTHIHLDHGGGAATLAKEFPDAKILCHPKAAKHIINPERLWKASVELSDLAMLYGEPDSVEEDKVIPLEDYSEVNLGKAVVKCIHTPGHASHHISFFLDRILFPGDSAGMCINRNLVLATPPPFNLQLFLSSLEKMKKLEPAYIAYTHFGMYEADDLLEKAKKKALSWSEMARNAKELDELKRTLFEEDEEVRNFSKFYEGSKIMKEWVDIGLEGILESVKK